MTAQRLVRGSKARIIAGLCLVLFCVAFIVLFQKTQAQLDNVNKNYEICVQQQESLSTQLQVIVDYKSRLEMSLQNEKSEHKKTRTELESRINDEKTRRDKTSMEANTRFQTLQQHYKLLQAKHEDLKDKSEKLQQEYLDDVDKLKARIKDQENQLKLADKNREKSLEHLKTLYMQLQNDKEELVEQLKNTKIDRSKWESDLNHLTKINHQLLLELEGIKKKNINSDLQNMDVIAIPQHIDNEPNIKRMITTTRKFSKQVPVAQDVYQIRDKNDNPLGDHEESNIPQIDIPNKAEQNHDAQVLQKPSSPSKSTPKTKSISQGNIGNARPLLLPTVTPSNKNTSKPEASNDFRLNSINVLPAPNLNLPKKLPPGVVPVPKQELQKPEEPQKSDKTDDKIPEEINFALPNRYRNNIIEAELAKEIIKEAKPEIKPNMIQNEPEVNGLDPNQQDNAAMEVIDQPKNPAQEDPLHLMDVNQPLEADDIKMKDFEQSMKDPVLQLLNNHKKSKKQHIDTLRAGNDNGAIRAPPGGAAYENEGDYDKDGQKEDLQIEEADPEGEEDDDGDDYDGHLAARQKEPAVRN